MAWPGDLGRPLRAWVAAGVFLCPLGTAERLICCQMPEGDLILTLHFLVHSYTELKLNVWNNLTWIVLGTLSFSLKYPSLVGRLWVLYPEKPVAHWYTDTGDKELNSQGSVSGELGRLNGLLVSCPLHQSSLLVGLDQVLSP